MGRAEPVEVVHCEGGAEISVEISTDDPGPQAPPEDNWRIKVGTGEDAKVTVLTRCQAAELREALAKAEWLAKQAVEEQWKQFKHQ